MQEDFSPQTRPPAQTGSFVGQHALKLQDQALAAKKAAGVFGTAQGVLADFIAPVGPVPILGGVVFGIVAIGTGHRWFTREKKDLELQFQTGKLSEVEFKAQASKNRWLMAFSYSLLSSAILLGFFFLGMVGGKSKKGFLATQIPALQKVQSLLLGIKKDVKDIKKDTKHIRKTVDSINKNIGAALKGGGLIPNPKTGKEFYHNARVYNQRGDRDKAREMLKACIKLNTKHIDPHNLYQKLLKNAEGFSHTKKIYYKLAQKYPKNPTVQLAKAQLFEEKPKRAAFRKILQQNPNYVPVIVALCEEFSPDNIAGIPSMIDKQREFRFLQLFSKRQGEDRLLSYYYDQKEAQKKLDGIEKRKKAYKDGKYLKKFVQNPIIVRAKVFRQGTFIVSIGITEPCKEIWYKLTPGANFRSTGHLAMKSHITGQMMPKRTIFTSGLKVGKNKIWVKFKNKRDELIGPLELDFTVQSKANAEVDRFVSNVWSNPLLKRISVGYFRGRSVITPIYATKSMIFKSFKYSINSKKLNRTLIKNGRKRRRYIGAYKGRRYTFYASFELINGFKSGLLKYKVSIPRRKRSSLFSPE